MCCQKCGKKIHKNQTVCPWCGASQKTKNEPVQVHLSATGAKKRKRLTDKQKKWIIGVSVTVGAILLALVIAVVSIGASLLGQIDRTSELSNIDVNPDLPPVEDVQNIALFGLDTRSDNESGRSDAIIILSIDRIHSKIKMTSIARDSLVSIEGHGQSKITHAFAWGKANLAVKTLNQNFGMNITDYAYINFFEFAEIIDYIGGVQIDVDSSEAGVMNDYYGPELTRLGFDYIRVSAGYQRLSGAQALAYSRNRYTGSDIDRGNRQKEVLEAMFAEVKDLSVTKYPSVISRILSVCHTNLTNGEMLSIATWAATGSPTVEQYTLPSAECNAKGGDWGDGHGWVWHFDKDLATDLLHKFIYEEAAEVNVTPVVTTTTSRTTQRFTTTTAPRSSVTASAQVTTPAATTTSAVTTTTTTTATTATTTGVAISTGVEPETTGTSEPSTTGSQAATQTTLPSETESSESTTESTESIIQNTDATESTTTGTAATDESKTEDIV